MEPGTFTFTSQVLGLLTFTSQVLGSLTFASQVLGLLTFTSQVLGSYHEYKAHSHLHHSPVYTSALNRFQSGFKAVSNRFRAAV